MKRFGVLVLLFTFTAMAVSAQPPREEPYSWKSVPITGGGFVDGIIFHPTAAGVRYARTDIGGAYRWDDAAHRWQPILDWVPYKDLNLMGVESIAVDPADPNRVYLACGTYTRAKAPNGAILRSDDRGQSFQRTDVPFKFGGNDDGRGNGERLAVDPRDGRILYLGTRNNGLWRSQDRGATWTRVTSFPDVTEAVPPEPSPIPGETEEQHWQRMPIRSSGIIFVKFDPATGSEKPGSATQTIYAGVSLMNRPNLFVSNDGGGSWHAIAGEPTKFRPARAALSADGFLYVVYGNAPGPSRMTDGAVWKLDTRSGVWSDITPGPSIAIRKNFGYAAVSVDAQHPRTLIVSSFGRMRPDGGDWEDIFRSTDGGASWTPIFGGGGVYDYSGAPYVKRTPIHWLFDIEIDPTDPDHAVFTTGYGGWETHDLTAADRGQPTHWSVLAVGIEETVPMELISPIRGAHLLSAIGDYGGFVHWDLDHPAPEGASEPPRFHNTTGLAVAALHPEILVRSGVNAQRKPSNIGYSLDAGRTWSATAAAPTHESHAGFVAVSADGGTWLWAPEHEPTCFTRDHGATWTTVQGLPADLHVIADPVDSQVFYAVSLADRRLYRSNDGGASFSAHPLTLPGSAPISDTSLRGDERGGQDRIYAAPERSADLWIAAFDGLYHALASKPQTNGNVSFARLAGVEEIQAFGFGKAAPHHSYPALYLVGTVNSQPGVFRSIDAARSWVRINDDQHQWGFVLQITGDPRIYGRVYVGAHGRGIFYGEPAAR